MVAANVSRVIFTGLSYLVLWPALEYAEVIANSGRVGSGFVAGRLLSLIVAFIMP